MPTDNEEKPRGRPAEETATPKRSRARRQARSKSLPSVKTEYGFAVRIRDLFEEGAKYHGRKVAQGYLRIFGAPPTKAQTRQMRDLRVIDRLLAMNPPQPYKLARELAEKNKTLPKVERWGTGTTNVRAMEKYVERLWKSYEAKRANPQTIASPVLFITER